MLDLCFWEVWLEQNKDLFNGIRPGARIGLIFDRELAGYRGKMLVWNFQEAGIFPVYQDFLGFGQTEVDVIFVIPPEILSELTEGVSSSEGSKLFRDLVRHRKITFFTLTFLDELQNKGYEDFLSNLGLDYVRGCVG